MICKNCGYENNDGGAFCAECGAPLAREEMPAPEMPSETSAEAPQPVFAPEAPESSAFTAQEAPQMPYAPTYPQPAAPEYAAPYAPAYPAPEQPTPVYDAPQPEKKKGKGGKIALIVTVIVLALALIAAGVWCYLLYTEKLEREEEDGALRVQLSELDGKLSQANDDYNALSDSYDDLTSNYDTLSADYKKLTEDYEKLSVDDTALQEDYEAMSDAYNEIWPTYDFFTKYGVICSEQNNYYHTYECEDWDHSAFWIYNIDLAKSKDFTPCPVCMAEAEEATP